MSYLSPVEQLGTTKGFYKNPSRIKGLDELFQQPVPCCVCPQMHLASLFPAADSRQNGIVCCKTMGWEEGRFIASYNSTRLFFQSVLFLEYEG